MSDKHFLNADKLLYHQAQNLLDLNEFWIE